MLTIIELPPYRWGTGERSESKPPMKCHSFTSCCGVDDAIWCFEEVFGHGEIDVIYRRASSSEPGLFTYYAPM